MDNEAMQIIREARKRTPRFLFRAWRDEPDAPSGGFQGLNTPDSITPRAFREHRAAATKTICGLTRRELQDMCNIHLAPWRNAENYYTEFSSWTASLHVALRFTTGRRRTGAFISNIDTTELPRNAIVHVPLLTPILGNRFNEKTHEYLAHGIISGSALKAVSLHDILNVGNLTYPPSTTRTNMQACDPLHCVHPPFTAITAQEINDAEGVGMLHGPKFGAAVMLAVLCLKKRDCNLWRNETRDLAQVLEVRMTDFDIPTSWRADRSIMKDVVNTDGYGEVEQMIRMLRAILDLRHKRRMRSRCTCT